MRGEDAARADRNGRIPRPSIERRLDAALAHRLTTLIAADGYGKSTVLERWADGIGAVIHRLTQSDRDLLRLARRVTAALRLRAPSLSPELTRALASPLGPDAGREASARAITLGTTLGETLHDSLRRHLVLVLDDVDVLAEGDSSARFLDALIRTAPHRLHIVAASRAELPFSVDRLRQQREIVELRATDLTLDVEEVRVWVAAILGHRHNGLAPAVAHHTGGWPVAVATTLQDLAKMPPGQREAALADSTQTTQLGLLVQEVYAAQPEPVRQLVAVATVVPTLTADLAAVLGTDGLLLESVHRTAPFFDTDASWPGAYRLTPTARSALEHHVSLSRDARSALAEKAASWYLAHDATELALKTLVAADATEPLTALVTEHARRLEAPAAAEDVLRALAALPDEAIAAPALHRLAGMAHQARGAWDEAKEILTDVMHGPVFDASVAWRLGLIHHLRGELDVALEIYDRGANAGEPAADAAICTAWAASVWWLRGERDECATIADTALERAVAVDDPRALAAAHMVLAMLAALDGDRHANDAHYLRAIDYAERADDVLQLIRIHSNRASHHLEEGAYEDALAELEVAQRLADLTGFTPFRALALSNRAEALVGLGRLEEAAIDAAASVAAWRALGSRLVSYALHKQAIIQQLRGDTLGAAATLREGIVEAETADDVQGLVPCLTELALVLIEEDREEAGGLLERALSAGESMNYVKVRLAAARLAIAEGDDERARGHLARAHDVAVARRDRPGLAATAELEAMLSGDTAMADEAIVRWRDVGDLVGLARAELVKAELGDDTAAAAVAATVRERLHSVGCRQLDGRIEALLARGRTAAPGPPISIETLGNFRVLHQGVAVPQRAWQSRKARELVKLLATRRGRPAPREWLTEQLWPDTDIAIAGKRLHVMTSTARAVLDPDRAWPGDHFIAGDREALRLDLRHVDLDVDRFLALVEEAAALERRQRHDEALEAWRQAAHVYTGDFCEDEPYADWAVGIREEARAAYGQVVARIAMAETKAGRHDDAVRLWLRLLERDPYDERVHLSLVAALLAGGRRGDAHRRYLVYVERAQELGVEPAPFPRSLERAGA